MRNLCMVGHIDNMTGYGQQNCLLVSGFQQAGIQPTVFATGLADKPEPVPANVKDCLAPVPQNKSSFLIQPPNFRPEHKTLNRVWFIVWEATKLDSSWVKRIDQSAAVVTPSDWNANCFSACGVEAPIYRVPLFVPTPYTLTSPVEKNTYVFGCSGHLGAQAPRKNLRAAVRAFLQAFPKTDDVELRIKTGEFDYVEIPDDRRITLIKGHLSAEKMKQWYTELDVFVHPSKSEGWGFQPLQALALGRPVIACKYGGVAEYFNETCGIELQYSYEPASGMYQDMGHWADPSIDNMAEAMLYAYNNPQEMARRGVAGAAKVATLTLENTISKLIPILEKHEIVI